VARLSVSLTALKDIARIEAFYSNISDDVTAMAQLAIADGLEIVTRHPQIGHPQISGLRVLIIDFGKSGFCALYSYSAKTDVVTVLRIRHQREKGFEP
jgi:plasmid stabilization system protein ParE